MSGPLPLTERIRPGGPPPDLAAYEDAGGYRALRKVLREMEPEEVQQAVKDSKLRGRGGAGFPTGMKWSFVPMGSDAPRPKYLVANADEMEPATFKDRLLMEGDPHSLVEAMIVSAFAIGAERGYVFLRWAYRECDRLLNRAIEEARAAGFLGRNILGSGFDFDLDVHVSAGRYMAGEETGLLDALEGRRATPRAKPPYPQASGLWGRPTVVQNVETLCCVPHIVNHGAEWFLDLSRTDNGGTKIAGVSGNLVNPGAFEVPMGTPFREIVEEHAGGMADGRTLRGFLPGGASTGFLTADDLDVGMDFDAVEAAGSRMGTGTLVVLDDGVCPVGMLLSLERFFARESCGWCTPCREGLAWVERSLAALEEGRGREEDIDRLALHGRMLTPGATFCALAPGAAAPLASALEHFREDFERHVAEKRCPWRK